MTVHILDLDGALPQQQQLLAACDPLIHSLRDCGSRIRLECSHQRFRQFSDYLADCRSDFSPSLSFIGSGDFHHVTLALLEAIQEPINLVIIDKHPDWMTSIPFMHCGTWVHHASRLPTIARIFHFGGDLDFDNAYRWLAPWNDLRSGKIVVFPAYRSWVRGGWKRVPNIPLRPSEACALHDDRLQELLAPYRDELASRPVYISLDKDVLRADEAAVNWDSGNMTLPEIGLILQSIAQSAGGRIAGMDIVGDWSPVVMRGWFRKLLAWWEHPPLQHELTEASRRNERTNLRLLRMIGELPGGRALLGESENASPCTKLSEFCHAS